MSTTPFSPQFLTAMKRPLGLPILCVRVLLMLPIVALALLGDLLRLLGRAGEWLLDLTQDWTHEVQVLTHPPVWTEITSLRDRCKAAEADAEVMRDICRDYDASLKRARDICVRDDLKDVPDWPVIQWPDAVTAAPMHQPAAETPSL